MFLRLKNESRLKPAAKTNQKPSKRERSHFCSSPDGEPGRQKLPLFSIGLHQYLGKSIEQVQGKELIKW